MMEDDNITNHLHIDFVGDGKRGYENKLLSMVDKYGLQEVVTFKGYVEKPQNILKEYDVGLMCSRSEAFGCVTAEYMMAGLAVIASNGGANLELIRDGIDGKIYPQGDCEKLKEAMKFMCNNSQDLTLMRKNARIRAEEMFTVESNTSNIRRIDDDILLQRNGD